MKLTLISNPSTIADEIYNTVAQNCNFYIDSNGEAFMVCYDRGTYTLVYLSYADVAKRFINLLVFQHYNCTVRNSDIQTAYDTICALVTACSKKVAVYTRVGRIENTVYYDLAGPSGDIVEITDSKVSVVKKSSVKGLFFSQDLFDALFDHEGVVDSDCGDCVNYITGETRYRFGYDQIDFASLAVCDHSLEILAVLQRCSRYASVRVYASELPIGIACNVLCVVLHLQLIAEWIHTFL